MYKIINNLVDIKLSKVNRNYFERLFDTILYCHISTLTDATNLQDDLGKLEDWERCQVGVYGI